MTPTPLSPLLCQTPRSLGQWAIRNSKAIVFITLILCLAGVYAAMRMPSSVFPQTNFPRVVILADNGVMPADEMMATVTRPIEEAMKDIPGATTITSTTGRGSAEINVFFNWNVDMVQSELFVLGRLGQIRSTLPATTNTTVWRLTFSAFPIIGVSLTSPKRDITELWETARYNLKPRFLRVPGVARVDIVGGRTPEYQIIVDPVRLAASGLSLAQVTATLEKNNLSAPAGLHEEDYTLYLTLVDGRVHNAEDIQNFTAGVSNGRPVLIKDFAQVQRGPEPVFNVVTADGVNAVLLNVRSQPNGSTLNIARDLEAELVKLHAELPADVKLAFFYDQSQLVRASVDSVWEAILFGLLLSVAIIYLFLRNWGTTLVAVVVIPVTVLITLVAMTLAGLSFNLMTLGGIAAAIGLVIDDAIVVVEAIYAKIALGRKRLDAISEAVGEIFAPLVASTITPVVVFLPLAFLDGITGVFFRALALTMVVSLLTSLLLAVTLTPSLAAWFIHDGAPKHHEGGPLLRALIRWYEFSVRGALKLRWLVLLLCLGLMAFGGFLFQKLESDFLPEMMKADSSLITSRRGARAWLKPAVISWRPRPFSKPRQRWRATPDAPAQGSRWRLQSRTVVTS